MRPDAPGTGSLDALEERLRARMSLDAWTPTGDPSRQRARTTRGAGGSDRGRISVVMVTQDDEATVEEALSSVLRQTHRKLELIVVDDASTDGTVEIVREHREEDERVRLLRIARRRGRAWARDLGILHAFGRWIAVQEPDRTSHPERIATQVAALSARRGAWVCWGDETAPDGSTFPSGSHPERAHATLAFDRAEVTSRVGFYDTVEVGAEEEFLGRLRRALPSGALVHVEEALCASVPHPDDGSAPEPEPPELAGYRDAFTAWHGDRADLFLAFPPRLRPLPGDTSDGDGDRDPVVASIASIPARRLALEQVVRAALPQVDRLVVYLNGYGTVPHFLDHPKITYLRSEEHGDLADNGKFHPVGRYGDAYHVLLDDDIDYPAHYVDTMVAKLRQYDHRAAVGVHGIRLEDGFERYFDVDSRDVHKFIWRQAEDRQVHLLGTGTVAFHSSTIEIDVTSFRTTRMADIWFALHAQRQDVPLVAISRPNRFIQPQVEVRGEALFERFRDDDERQTELVLEQMPWTYPSLDLPGGSPEHLEPFRR